MRRLNPSVRWAESTTNDIVDSGLTSAGETLGYAEQEFEKALKTKDMLLYRNAVDKATEESKKS